MRLLAVQVVIGSVSRGYKGYICRSLERGFKVCIGSLTKVARRLWGGTAEVLRVLALQGYSAIGHCKDILKLCSAKRA